MHTVVTILPHNRKKYDAILRVWADLLSAVKSLLNMLNGEQKTVMKEEKKTVNIADTKYYY